MANIELSASKDSLFSKMRQAMAAQGRPLYTRPWIGPDAWVTGTTYKAGQVVKNSGAPSLWYVAVSTGTSGTTEPTHVNGSATTDGGVLWTHIGGKIGDPANDVDGPIAVDTGSTATPTGLTAIDVWANRSLFRMRGCYALQYVTNRLALHVFDKKVGTTGRGGCSVAFWSDAVKIGFEVLSGTPGISINVDGRPVKPGITQAQLAGNYWSTLEWSGRRPRLYEIYFEKSNSTFMRVGLAADAQVWPEKPAIDLTSVFIGDSYLDGSSYGPFLPGNTLSEGVGRLTGITDIWRFGTGGTGLINQGGASYYTYIERVPEMLSRNPDVIWIYGSTNDSGSTAQAINTAALALLDTIRAGTSAPIFWLGPASLNIANLAIVDTQIAAAVAARPNSRIYYKSMVLDAPPWLTGAHNNSAYAWSSNIGQYIGGDNVHPVDKGTAYLADRAVRWYSEILKSAT